MSVADKIEIQLKYEMGVEVWGPVIPVKGLITSLDAYHDSANKNQSVGAIYIMK